MSLNCAQKNAIEFIKGPCLILAGAGSGKTKVIINKIIYLINHCKYKPDNITAVTFTNKSANEMKLRLSKNIKILEIKKMIISTFHALGLEIIKKEIDELKINDNFTIFDEKDQLMLLKKICHEEKKNDLNFLRKIHFMISYWKNQFYSPMKVKLLARSHMEKTFACIYTKYNNHLQEFNTLDFDDLICIPTLLLKSNQIIQNRWQKKISYLLVDEYQDTNNSQYEFIKTLTKSHSSFTLVGDDDQSIYSWRGANPQNLFLIKKDFPSLKIIKMEHNYRSSGRILKVANSLISHNIHYLKKKLFSQLKYGNLVEVIVGKNEENEAEKIVQKIMYKHSNTAIQYQDFAILYRGNYQARIFEKILIKENIPYNISENSSFFARLEIKDLLSYLRIIINPNDNYALMRIINVPSRKIGIITLQKLEKWALKENKTLFQAMNDVKIKNFLTQSTVNKIDNFILWIKKIIDLSHVQPLNILEHIIHDIQYKSWLSKIFKESDKIQNSINNIHTLLKWFKNMMEGSEFEKPMTLSKIVAHMTLRDISNKKIEKNEKNGVQLMTLHASKGLEFRSVFIIGMCEGILPNHKSIHNNNIEEERRLAYVGITRAKKELFLSYCCTRAQYGQIENMSPSRFLSELPQEDLEWNKTICIKNFPRNTKINKLHLDNLKKKIKSYTK